MLLSTKSRIGKDRTSSAAWLLIISFCTVHFVLLACWLHFKLDDFYYYLGDDVGRIMQALHWARLPSLRPTGDQLPLTTCLFGGLLAAIPDPYQAPLLLQSLLATASLAVLGLLGIRLGKEGPLSALLPMSLATQVPLFEQLGLSAGAEVSMWFLLLLSAWLWLLYLDTRKSAYCLLSAACLFLASITRYEAWLYIAAFFPIAGLTFYRRRSPRLALAYLLLSVAFIAFFIYYQELHMVQVSGEQFSGLPLSYRGIRLYFNQPNPGVMRSFLAPIREWVWLAPWLAAIEVVVTVYVFAKMSNMRWYCAWWLLSFSLLCLEAGIFGISTNAGRLVVFFHLLLAPIICCLCLRLLKAPWSLFWLLAPIAALALLPTILPRLSDSELWRGPGCRDTYIIAKAVHDEERDTHLPAMMLVELRRGPGSIIWDTTPLRFAVFDRLRQDRQWKYDIKDESLITQDNPSVFSLPRRALERYLKENGIGWIVVWSPSAAASLAGLTQPVATVGSRTLLTYEIPPDRVARCRQRIQRISARLSAGPPKLIMGTISAR